MAYAQNRILELLKIFLEETDENHYITMEELARRLQADRRTIEQDIFSLQQADFDIVKKPRPKLSFALLSRKFTLEEIKLLLDCVQVSKFLSEKKTEELTKKLYSLCSHYEAAQLNGQVHRNRIKSGNESIYRHIDMIHTAISSKLLLSFQYMEYLPSRERRARHNGKRYVVYPCALIYSEENYYLLAVEAEEINIENYRIKHFRVDRMKKANIIERYKGKKALSLRAPFIKDIDNYTKQNFSMYGGKTERVTIQFPNHFAGVVFDRFGSDVQLSQTDKDYFQITESIAVSPQFYGWVFGLGKEVKIIEPNEVKQEMKALLKDTYGVYTIPRNRKKKVKNSQ